MQVLRLEFAGIGPFTGRHAIDFRALGEGGLFLLEGPTGAGKTTIIDALVFALYGDVAGADSSRGRLVSTQLPAGLEPFVDLTIETSRGVFRVRRVPEHTRRKARGSGTTIGRASIKLWRLAGADDAEGTLLSTSLQDATEELQRALGLTKKQFTQTVVLPQGDFATFLRAKPEERRGVLQDIFGTELYERCARELAERSAGFRKQDADAQAALSRAVAGFAAVAWAGADERRPFAEAATDAEVARALASDRIAEIAWLVEEAEGRVAAATEASAAADAALRAVRERHGLIDEHVRLTARLAALTEAAPAVARDAEVLRAADRAEGTRHAMDAVARARAALESARTEASRGVSAVADSADADLVGSAHDEASLRAEAVTAREGRSALTDLVEKEGGLRSRAEQLRLDVDRLAARRRAVAGQRARVEADRGRATELGPELEALVEIAETRADCVQAEAGARATRQGVARLEEISRDFAAALGAEKAAAAKATEASESHRAARAAWLGGLAGTLASELTGGQPCPVCGSKRHPSPASLPEGAVDRAAVERLEVAATRAGQEAAAAQARSDALATAMHEQQEAVGEVTVIEAELALTEAVEHRRMAERAGRQASELRARITALLTGADERERALRAEEGELAAEKARVDVRAERLEQDRLHVREHLAGFTTIADRSAALALRAERAARLAGARRGLAEAEASVAERDAELAGVLTESGFESPDAARAALLPARERDRLRAALDDHRAQLASVTDRLTDARFEGIVGAEAVDVAPVEGQVGAARAALDAALAQRGALEAMLAGASEASGELDARARDLAEVRAEAAPYLAMADLANGGGANLANITLPTFVLLRRFEEVVDLANARLDQMTAGRYSLRRTDAREGRSHKLGLGLEVVDHASADAARDPKTLSGGETFQASLALALGLADAVTAEAGGVELNTLFVDEGFGSLDPEALDMVMEQLTALRDGGRAVGVVSHVAEMKQRIAERVTVIPRRDGTSTLTCSTDDQPALAG